MRINSKYLGYREVEKLGELLKELGDDGTIRGWDFELDDLEITYNPSYDIFEFNDGTTEYKIELCMI